MKNIKISIIIPVYKVEKFLKECVDSVVNQSYKNLEIILVDDGSPDSCPEMCDDLAKQDNRIVVIHKENGGLSDARNAGMKVATGDYFVFLDSDDYWMDNSFIETVVSEKLVEEKDVVFFGYTKDKNLLYNYKRNIDFENEFSNTSKEVFLQKAFYYDKLQSTSCNKIVNTKLIKNFDMDFEKGRLSEDIDWVARLILHGENFAYFDKYIYFYRENEESITHTMSSKTIVDLKYNIEKIVSWSEKIKDEKYYETYMNYCAYQYITFLNCICQIDKCKVKNEIREMKKYSYLLRYNVNKKVKLVSIFKRFFGFNGMLFILKLFLKIKG